MKRFLLCVSLLCSLQAVKAAPHLLSNCSTSLLGKNASDTVIVPVLNPAVVDFYHNNIYKRRLDSIQKEVPLPYNGYVQSYIDNYLSSQRAGMGRVLGLSKYYFPIYEKAFRDAGIPDEIKYLSIVESQLNPYAVSRVGATGPWQFMSNTAKVYGLNMDSYIDERRDPIQSSIAAAAYLKDSYQEFGDWLLAIASYNCGKSNVIRAIEQAGSNDFWAIRQYLPAETRGYVPAYIAVTYLMHYYKIHNIMPQECNFVIKTDTVLVSKYVSLNSVSRVLGVDLTQLAILNPCYKTMIINGSASSPKRLVLPQTAKDKFSTLYNSLNSEMAYNAMEVDVATHNDGQPAESKAHRRQRVKGVLYLAGRIRSGGASLQAAAADNSKS
jgi:membrane-bound lytic murein transglycosylase D